MASLQSCSFRRTRLGGIANFTLVCVGIDDSFQLRNSPEAVFDHGGMLPCMWPLLYKLTSEQPH